MSIDYPGRADCNRSAAAGAGMGQLRDASAKKERLRISEERFQLAMDAACVGLWIGTPAPARFYSPLWMSMLGYAEGELASLRNLLQSAAPGGPGADANQ